jgi:flavin reductase (DIM6/NTAB) family NADH-FMN oxidoreductase RutF
MDIQWNDRRTRQFVTNVGLITSDGPYGADVMAAEWTHHMSYSPCLIAVNIRGHDATAHNIEESKEFGVNLAGEDQNILCSISGRFTATKVDKVQILNEFGVKFYPGRKIACLMIENCAMNAECKLVKREELGDHIMFIGEVVEISADENIKPLIYHNGKYWKMSDTVERPPSDILEKINELGERYKK